MSRASQRHLERLIAEDEERGVGSIQDAAFFKQNPNRHYRMRLATSGEIAAIAPLPLPADALLWVVVKQIAPGMRMRALVQAPLPVGPINDIPEHIAREVFETYAVAQELGK